LTKIFTMRIYLLGFMGCGKSSLGKRLASRLDYDFYDIDHGLEEKKGMKVPEIFSTFGEETFRKWESEVLKETANMDNVVIATGGGTPCHFDNMDFILKHGISVYLRMDVASLANRLENSRKIRPLVARLSGKALLEEIENRLTEREPYYMRANCIVKGESVKSKHIISLVFGE
jgi:shikimate kinase